jgi:hypothetical protein
MKTLRFLLCLILLASPALAQTAHSPFVQKMVDYHTRIATAFGCTNLANQNFDSQLAVLEFLPNGQSFPNWGRMFSVNVLPLPDQQNQVLSRMTAFRQNLLDAIGKQGKLLDVRDLKTTKGLPVTYIEYVASDDKHEDHAVGVFAQHSALMAAFTQIQMRDGNLSPTDRSNMEQLAINMSKR